MKWVGLFVGINILGGAVPCIAADWAPIDGTAYFLNMSTLEISSDSKNLLVAFKRAMPESVVESFAATTGKDYSHYGYTILHYEINCLQKTARCWAFDDYADNGRQIHSFHHFKEPMSPVEAGSDTDLVVTTACKASEKKK